METQNLDSETILFYKRFAERSKFKLRDFIAIVRNNGKQFSSNTNIQIKEQINNKYDVYFS